jgi:hypothetical protein
VADSAPDRLPNAERANSKLRRIRDYLLNTAHITGAPESAVFHRPRLRFTRRGVVACVAGPAGQTNAVVRRIDTAWGPRRTVACHCQTPDGRNPRIRTLWQIEQGVPRLRTVLPRP